MGTNTVLVERGTAIPADGKGDPYTRSSSSSDIAGKSYRATLRRQASGNPTSSTRKDNPRPGSMCTTSFALPKARACCTTRIPCALLISDGQRLFATRLSVTGSQRTSTNAMPHATTTVATNPASRLTHTCRGVDTSVRLAVLDNSAAPYRMLPDLPLGSLDTRCLEEKSHCCCTLLAECERDTQ